MLRGKHWRLPSRLNAEEKVLRGIGRSEMELLASLHQDRASRENSAASLMAELPDEKKQRRKAVQAIFLMDMIIPMIKKTRDAVFTPRWEQPSNRADYNFILDMCKASSYSSE